LGDAFSILSMVCPPIMAMRVAETAMRVETVELSTPAAS
jgi:hypothetical protein